MVKNVHKLESNKTKSWKVTVHLNLKFQHSNICLNFEVFYFIFFFFCLWVRNLITGITNISFFLFIRTDEPTGKGSNHDWGTPFKSWESTPRTSKFTFFFNFPMTCLTFHFLMTNEIILFQILYGPLKYLLFSLMKVKIIKFIQCGPCSINGPKLPKI
jgi:hypothetical protein